jgi:hypothetical protein
MAGRSMQPAESCCLCAPMCLHGGTRHHALRLLACRIIRSTSTFAKQSCWCCPYCPCNLQWHVCAVSHATMGITHMPALLCPLWTCAQLLMVCEWQTQCSCMHRQHMHGANVVGMLQGFVLQWCVSDRRCWHAFWSAALLNCPTLLPDAAAHNDALANNMHGS